MSNILDGLGGVICHMDDILIHGISQEEHDGRVRKVLQRLQEAGLTLNEKCEFSRTSMRFLGHIISASGLAVDPAKTAVIRDFPAPSSVPDLQRFLGMVNQLGKFLLGLAVMTEQLRGLLRKDTVWMWEEPQQLAFENIQCQLTSSGILAHYDPKRPTIVAADASANGLGAVLLQTQDDGRRAPICYASRSLTDTEGRYAVIEKEALAATWACEKMSDYILGLDFALETDHRPLVPLLSTKDLSKMPPQILRFRRMMRFNPRVIYVPGKNQITADALSRAPVCGPDAEEISFVGEVETFASHTSVLPATEARLKSIREAQEADEVCSQVVDYCRNGWPACPPQQPLLRPFWENRQHLATVDNLLLYDYRVVIPRPLRLEVLQQLHEGHLGITKCRARARESVWWPLLSTTIGEMVTKCSICAKLRPERKEPLMPSEMLSRPWEQVGMDLFEHGKNTFLLMVDYYSRWIEVRLLQKTQTAEEVIRAMQSIFAIHGIPDVVISDNGPQYASREFRAFASTYGFTHGTSSPRYPQANGEAERAVQTSKNILKKSKDPYLGFLAYRTAPLQNGLSPCQLLMGRKLRTILPTLPGNLQGRV